MLLNETGIFVQQYLALLMPTCTVLTGCCSNTGLQWKDYLEFSIQNPTCVPMCALFNRIPLNMKSLKGISANIPRAAYCTIECITRNLGLVNENGEIVHSKVLRLVEHRIKPNKAAKLKCFKQRFNDTLYKGQMFNNKVMKYIMCLWKEEQQKCPLKKMNHTSKCKKLKTLMETDEEMDLLEILWCMLPVEGIVGNPRPWD